MPHRLIILTGPSCVGKTPLVRCLTEFYPDLSGHFKKLVLYYDRRLRPKEKDGVDFYFRPRSFIESLRQDNRFLVKEVRGNFLAVDMPELIQDLKHIKVLYEGKPLMARALLTHPRLSKISKISIFVSPVSLEEIDCLQRLAGRHAFRKNITYLMRHKLYRRAQRQKWKLSRLDYLDIERRAQSAYGEIKEAWRFDHVIVNHDGEDSGHWDARPFPIGDAGKAVKTLAALLKGRRLKGIESWKRI